MDFHHIFTTVTKTLLLPLLMTGVMCVWIVYITFYNSRVVGSILTWIINKVRGSNIGHIHIGSFSFSALSGKVMLRDVAYVTGDYTFRCQDALIVLRWWRPYKPLPANCKDASQSSTRLNVFLFGVEFHCYNRSALYSEMEKKFGLPSQMIPESNEKRQAHRASEGNLSTSQVTTNETSDQASIWRDFFGVVKFEITSGRLVFGNPLVPNVLVVGVEELRGTYSTTSPSYEWDLYMHDINCSVDELRIMLAPSKDYMAKVDKAPRFMGEGFVVCKSSKAKIHYYYDEAGLQPTVEKSEGLDVPPPCWAMDITCDKSNQFTYGPWADRQRGWIQKFFYPQDYKTMIPTEEIQPGQRRQFANFDLRLNIVSEASLEVLFIKNEEAHNFYMEMGKGSYVETRIPFIVEPTGYVNKVTGQLLFLNSNTNLAFAPFIKSETLQFDVSIHYPLMWNHHQNWDLSLNFNKANWSFIYDHKEFLADIISDWSSKEDSDLLTFVPFTVNLNICLKEFEIILPNNQYNWIDTSGQENVCIGLIGDLLEMSVVLPFSEFRPDIVPIRVLLRADSAAAMLYLPESYVSRPCLAALDKSAKGSSSWEADRNAMKIPKNMWKDFTSRPGWVEAACAPVVAVTVLYNYHPVPLDHEVPVILRRKGKKGPLYSTLPPEQPHGGFRKSDIITEPAAELTSDLLHLEVDIGPLSVMAYGSIVTVILAIKENYLGEFQSITTFDGPEYQEIPANFKEEEKRMNPLGLRHLDVTVSLNIDGIKGHLPVHCSKADENCPVILMEQHCLELQKTYEQTRIQLLLSPILVTVTDKNQREGTGKHLHQGYLGLSGVQLRCHAMFSGNGLPPETITVEYAWLVDLQLGSLCGKLSPSQALCLVEAIQLFLHLALDDMDDLKPIEPIKFCVHMIPQKMCTMKEAHYGTPCPEEGDLKYRMTRLHLSGVQLQIVETDCALDLRVEGIRLASCNAHSHRVKDGLTLSVQDISVHQYVCNSNNGMIWLDAGSVIFGPLNVDLVQFIQEKRLTKAKKHFLKKHDTKTKRLWFLWNAEELTSLQATESNHDECGCHGGCMFFTLKQRDPLRHGDNISMPGLMWRPDSFQAAGHFGESLLKKGQVAFAACDRTPDDSPTKMFKFTRGWVHSSPSSSPDEVDTFTVHGGDDGAPANGPSSSEKEAKKASDTEEDESDREQEQEAQSDTTDKTLVLEAVAADEKTVPQNEAKGSSVKRTASLTMHSKVREEASKMTGSSYSLPTAAFRVKVAVDDSNVRQRSKSRPKSTGDQSSSESVSDSEYYSANEDSDAERTKARAKSVSETSVSKVTLSPTTTEGTSTYSSAQSPTEEMTAMSSLKVNSPSRKVSTSSTISFRSTKSAPKGSKDNLQSEKDQIFLGYIPYLNHNQCQEWLKVSPTSVESWRATDPYTQPFCGNFLRTGIMSPPQFHVAQQGLGPSMIAERPRDQDLSEMEEDICEQEESNDEDESFLLKGKSPALASGTAIKVSIDGPINILLTPLFLDAANRILESAVGSLAGQHPGSLLESIHHNSISHALNTAKKVQKKGQVNTTPSETKLTVILPQINLCLVQAQPTTPKSKENTASLLVLHLEMFSFNLMTLRSKPIEDQFTPSPQQQESSPGHTSMDGGCQPLLDSMVSSMTLSQAHCQMRRLQEGRNLLDEMDLPTAIPVQHSRVSFCLDPLDFESLKRGMNTSFNISEDMVQPNITTTIMAEGGVEEIAVSLGNGVEKMGSVNAARRKLARSLSKEYGSSPPVPKRKLTRHLSREQQSPAAQKHPRAKSSENEGQNIGQGATSLVIRVDSFWNHVPTPPHPRREQTATLNDFNLLTTASPALDSWLHSASNLNFLFEKTMKSRHLRNIALMTYAMAESHESSFKPVLPQSKKYYSKSGEAINSDLSCQLILILWKYMIQTDEVEAEKSIGNEDLPAITTLETGARVLLRQWKANLQMLNPCLSTMNWNKQLEDSEIEMNKLGTLDSEGYLENSDGTILDEFPSDGSALNGTRTSVDQSEHASMSGYNRGQIYSKLKYSMYDEFSDRKRSRNVSAMSSQGESGSKSANTSYTRLLNPQRSNTSGSSIEGSVFATRTSGGHTYLPVTDLECVTELSMGSVSSDEDNDVEADERLSQNGDILINRGWSSPTSQPSSPGPIMSSSATQIGDIEVIFKPVLKYFNLNTRDKVSAIKQIVEVVGQLSVLFTLEDFEICITKTSSKAMKDKHTKKLSRGKTFHRRDSPAFSCQDISLRLAIQESLKESSLVTAADNARVASSPAGGNKEAEISGNIEVVLNIHFGTVLQVVNMAILRLIIQVAQVIKNFQRAKTDLMLKEYASTLPTEGEVMPFQSYLLGQSPQKRTSLPKSGYRSKSANQEDDLDSLSSKSGSEVMPQCWQTMYHLLNLYSDREEDRPHVYENPLFSVENETGDRRMFYRNRHTADSHSSGEESFASPPPVRGSSSSIGLSLTCTLGVDEFCLLAELAGLHLEVEVFQIVLGVTAAQSLLNQAYPGFVKKLPDVSASLQSPSISAILSKTSKTELLTIGSLTIEHPQLSGATSSQELSRIHITSLVCIPSIVLDVPLDISMLTDIAAEASKKLAFRIRQLQQAERSYKTHHNELVPPLLEAADTGVSDHSGFDFLPDNRNSWIISTVAKINSISIQAALLPQLFTQYLIENTCCTFKWKDEGQIFATIPKHTLKFHAKNGETESSAEVVFPEINFTGDLQNPSNGTPDVPTGSRTSAKNLMLFKATLEVASFHHNLRSTLLNYILILQKILAQELTVLQKELQNHSWPSLEDISSKSKTTDQPKKPLCLYTLLVHFKGLQLTACSPSSSAVRLEMGVVELELSNMKEDKVHDEDMTDGSIDDVGVDILIHAKALIELGLSLGTLVRNPVFLEAEPEFDEVAYFKTKVGLTNSPKGQQSDEQKMKANNGDRSSGKQTFLVSLIKPVLFIQPHAVDKGLMVWMSYKGAYEQFIQQWKDGNEEGILLGAAPSTSSSQATLPLKRRRTVPTHTTFLFQLSVKEVAICVPFVQMHQSFSSSGSKSDLENPAALIISLESSLVSAHFRSSLVTKGFFNAFCLRFTENFQVAMDDWLPDFNGDLYNACCVPHGSFEVGSKVDSVATDGSQGQWKVGFRWHMKGLDVKVDPSIGHYLSGLINTMTSIAGSEDVADLTSVTETQEGSSNDALSDQEGKRRRPSTLKLKEEDGKKTNFEIINELNEQAKVVSDLKTLGAKSGTIQEETERLAKLEAEAQRDAKRAMRRKLLEMGKSMARRDDALKKKREPGDKLTPTDETPGKKLAERRQTLYQLRQSSSSIRPRAVSTTESPDLREVLNATPFTPSTPYTPKDRVGPPWWTERKVQRSSVVAMDTRNMTKDLNMTIGEPSRFQEELMVRRRRFMLQTSQTFEESDSASGSDMESEGDATDGRMVPRSLRDDGQSGLPSDEEEDAGTEAEAGPVAPDIQLDLDVIVNIDSGKLSFICYQKADENPEMLFARPPGDKKSGSLPAWTSKTSMWSDAAFTTQPKSPQGITFFAIPSVDVKAHYSSQQAGERTAVAQSARTTSPPSSPLHPRQDPGQQKRGLMYVWAQMKSPEDEIVVTTSILDFLEQALKVIPTAVDTADATSPTESQPSHPKEDETDIDASTNSLVSSSAVDYTTFPVDVIVYFLVQPSVIHLTCLPASRVECLLQLPCTELSFSSTEFVDDGSNDVGDERFTSPNRRRQFSGDDSMDARKSANSGLHCSIVLSNFSLVVFHPYGEQFRKDLSQKVTEQQQRQQQPPSDASGGPDKPQVAASMSRNALSLEVNLVKVNISRQRSREFRNIAGVSFFHGSPAGAPMSPARTIINQFSVICDMGSASFQYDMRRLTEMLAFPKAWYRKSLAKRLFLGKEARSPDEESYSGSDSGSQTDDELSSSSTTSSSDTEDSFSRLPSRHVKRRSPLRKGTSFQQTPASPGNRSKRIQEEPSSGDDEDTASPNLSMGQRKAKLPSRRERLQSLHTRSIKDDDDVQGVRDALKKLSKKEGRPQSPQVTKQDRAPKWKTVVVIAINVDKLDTNINMSNVMGTTILTVEELRSQSNILMDSNKQRDLHLITNLASLSLESKGGVVGGLLDTKGLHVEVSQKRLQEREPHHNIKIGVGFFAFRLDYMGSRSLLANLTGLQVSEKDEWKCTMKGKERHLQSMYTNTAIYWDTMHLIICRSTTPDIFKSVNRLEEFVVQQLQSSKKMLSSWKPPGLESEESQELPGGGHRRPPASSGKHTKSATEKVSMVTPGAKRKLKKQVSLKPEVIEAPPVLEESHWYTIFKWCRQVFGSQSSSLAQGLQLGGQVTLQGKKAVVTCFHGLNFRSSSWALFALREPHIQFETNAFEAPPEQGKSNTLVVQNLTFDLGHNQTQREDGWLAMIHRVYRNEKSHFPFNGTIAECFQYVSEIRCPEETEHYMRSQEFFPPSSSSSYKHKADPIFALPKLQMVMESKQHLMADGTLQDVEPLKVQVTFVTTFTDHLYVSMDVELLLFLHDLVIAYMEYKQKAMSLQQQSTSVASAAIKTADTGKVKGQTVKGEQDGKEKEEKKDEAPPSPSKDKREFNCSTWQLEPTVRLLSWGGKQIEPVGADYILHKLGFKHARTTIPKWIQRGVMDPSDIAVSFIVREMLKMMDEGSDDEKETKKTEVKRT